MVFLFLAGPITLGNAQYTNANQPTLIVDPPVVQVVAGSSGTSALHLQGASGHFAFNATNVPRGMTVAFQPSIANLAFVNQTFQAGILVITTPDLTLGNYSIGIDAIGIESNATVETSLQVDVLTSVDLHPENIQWTPLRPQAGDDVTFSVSVRNSGYIAVSAEVSFLVDMVRLSTQTNQIYAKQAVMYYSDPWRAPQPQVSGERHNVTVIVDPRNLVKETDKTNNNSTGFFFVNSRNYTITLGASGLQGNYVTVKVNGTEKGEITDRAPVTLSLRTTQKASVQLDGCVNAATTERLCTDQSSLEVSSTTPSVITIQYVPEFIVQVDKYPDYAPEPTVLPQGLNCTADTCWYSWRQTLYVLSNGISLEGVQIALKQIQIDDKVINATQLFPVVVDKSHVIRLIYARQFRLQVETEYSNISGNGWYAEGSTAQWKLSQSQVWVDLCANPWSAFCPVRTWATSNNTVGNYLMTEPRDGRVVWLVDSWGNVLANLIWILQPLAILMVLLPLTLVERKILSNKILSLSVGYVLAILLWPIFVVVASVDLPGWVAFPVFAIVATCLLLTLNYREKIAAYMRGKETHEELPVQPTAVSPSLEVPLMYTCPKCGMEVQFDPTLTSRQFCNQCGTLLDWEEQQRQA